MVNQSTSSSKDATVSITLGSSAKAHNLQFQDFCFSFEICKFYRTGAENSFISGVVSRTCIKWKDQVKTRSKIYKTQQLMAVSFVFELRLIVLNAWKFNLARN